MTTRDQNPDRLDDGARAEAEMKEREAPAYGEPVAWRYQWRDVCGNWSEWMVCTVDPRDWTWPPTWKDFDAEPLYAALPAPQGDDGLVERLVAEAEAIHSAPSGVVVGNTHHALNWGDKPHRVVYDAVNLIREASDALRSQAAEIAGLKAELADARKGNRYARLERLAIKRAEAAEAERDHWREYSSGQGKLIESGVFVKNEEYMRLAAAEARLAAVMEALTRIADTVDFRHASGLHDYQPALTASQAQEIAFTTLSSIKGAAE